MGDELMDERTVSDEVEPDQGSGIGIDEDPSDVEVAGGGATKEEIDAAVERPQDPRDDAVPQ